MNPLPVEISRTNNNSLSQPISAVPSSDSPAVGTPRRAFDMLVWALKNRDTPPEVRANVCALVGHLGRRGVMDTSRARDVQVLKDELKDVLEQLAKGENIQQEEYAEEALEDEDENVPKNLAAAAKRALEAWV
jgi:hypothetical protein